MLGENEGQGAFRNGGQVMGKAKLREDVSCKRAEGSTEGEEEQPWRQAPLCSDLALPWSAHMTVSNLCKG